MALKDTLIQLKRRQEEPFEGEQPLQRDEWVAAVGTLIDDVKTFLAPFEADGVLSVHERELSMSEDMLGPYTVRAATIEAGPEKIDVIPVGRMTVGAIGRVDLSRQGYARSSQRILMLRLQDDDVDTKRWMLRMPIEIKGSRSDEFDERTRQFDFQYLPFDRENLEKAIDFLLSL